MKCCPIDWQESGFRAAHHTTSAVQRQATDNYQRPLTPALAASTQHYTLCPGCAHAEAFARTLTERVFTSEQKAAIEAQWHQETERLFADYTRAWTGLERDRHRAKLWPVRRTIEDWAIINRIEPKPLREDASDENMDWPATGKAIGTVPAVIDFPPSYVHVRLEGKIRGREGHRIGQIKSSPHPYSQRIPGHL